MKEDTLGKNDQCFQINMALSIPSKINLKGAKLKPILAKFWNMKNKKNYTCILRERHIGCLKILLKWFILDISFKTSTERVIGRQWRFSLDNLPSFEGKSFG